MPYKPKVPCKYPLCPELINPGERYCAKHRKQPTSEYESKRNAENSKVYNTTWRRLRDYKLKLNPLCEYCLEKNPPEIVPATEVDHIKPVKLFPWLRLVLENLKSACTPCHSKKTRKENKKNNN